MLETYCFIKANLLCLLNNFVSIQYYVCTATFDKLKHVQYESQNVTAVITAFFISEFDLV